MNDIVKFCDKKRCENSIRYNKLATGGNNPHMSSKMKYSQRIQNYSRSRSSLDSESNTCKTFDYNVQNGIQNCPASVLAKFASMSNNNNNNNPTTLVNSISTTTNNILSTKFSAFPCTNPIFRGQNIYSSRNVSQCKCLSF